MVLPPRLLLLAAILVLGGALVGEATGSARGSQHAVYSHNWQGISFVSGLDRCPLFGRIADAFYEFDSVDLTDHINSRYTPATEPLFQIDSVGSLNGVINTPRGAFTVAGGAFREHRVDQLDPLYFSGAGAATNSAPTGSVTRQAHFQDLTDIPPAEFDLFFTKITSCHLE